MAAIIVALIVYFGHERKTVEAAPVVTDWCFNVCDTEASCTEPCLVVQGELPALEITCGEYDGGPINDWCNGDGCEEECSWWSSPDDVCWWQNEETTCQEYGDSGDCGDDICVGWQGENCATCPEDCGGDCPEIECGNSECELGETWRNCPQDCDPPPTEDCGDGTCGPEEDVDNCLEDCGSSGEYCGPSPYLECENGWVCVQDQCVWDDPNKFQCCGGGTFGCANGPNSCPFGYSCELGVQFFTVPVCVKMWGAPGMKSSF